MHRIKNHKIKREMPESSSSLFKDNEEHDLAYYIHDRVELMHQVFSVIKSKELKAMAPQCVQHISMDDLQELCTEELLGISSKRLCAVLDGADPPTDTESSSSEQLETISLDSISSDDEILSQHSSKSRKQKHKKHKSKSKHKRKNSSNGDKNKEDSEDRSKASRAGLTVLELLELQARARAIRAQLQKDNGTNKAEETTVNEKESSSEDEVEIKEEPAEVVEISSEEEKPSLKDLLAKSSSKDDKLIPETSSAVKRINNLIITVPQSNSTKKIKLKRNKTVTLPSTTNNLNIEKEKSISSKATDRLDTNELMNLMQKQNGNKDATMAEKSKNATKKKQKKKAKVIEKDGSDQDEITLQLSDTEKMDLLENFDRKNYENLTSSSSKDSESSSDSSAECDSEKQSLVAISEINKINSSMVEGDKSFEEKSNDTSNNGQIGKSSLDKEGLQTRDDAENNKKDIDINPDRKDIAEITEEVVNLDKGLESSIVSEDCNVLVSQDEHVKKMSKDNEDNLNKDLGTDYKNDTKEQLEEGEVPDTVEKNKDLSDGEISDKESVENESHDTSTDIVNISDEEKIKNKKNKKKDKKTKKEKKSKKSKKDFHKGADQNFFDNTSFEKQFEEPINLNQDHIANKCKDQSSNILIIDDDNDDIYEILELSDDSEGEGESVLSDNPTAAEITALSAKIDGIHTEDIVIDSENEASNGVEDNTDNNEVENISWKDRYLGSKKVKKVLTTANILNALRKKNKDLKKKIEESKLISEETLKESSQPSESNTLIEGSIEHFNTLQASTKYVDPVVNDNADKGKEVEENKNVTKEMKKDAKLLLKMYKKLLKYNDINKQKDPMKKKKKKHKKNKDKT